MSWIMTVSKLSYWETSSVHGEVSLSPSLSPPRDVNQGVNSDGITKGNYSTMPLTHLDVLPSWLNLRGELWVRLEINMKWKVERTPSPLHLLSFHSPVNKWNAHHSQEVQYKSVQSHSMSDKCNFVRTSAVMIWLICYLYPVRPEVYML